MWAIICYSTIGFVVGCLYALLFINFDASWKKILSFMFSISGSGGFIFVLGKYFEIEEPTLKLKTSTALIASLFLGFVMLMIIMCKLIKDKDDNDILRIRDILLGQKSYIDKYYAMRGKEIDERKLNFLELERREKIISEKEIFLEEERMKINELGNKKLKLSIPISKNVIITDKFIKLMPALINDFSKFVHQVELVKSNIILKETLSLNDVKTSLLFFASCVSYMIFGGGDVRVHFRYYNENENVYEEFISVIGRETSNKKMTSIPYDNSMIKKSFECKRCLIKSVNSDFDFQSQNYIKWKDYMTYSFQNCIRNGKPYLTFGISVKNEERYKDTFYFLNYIEIEEWLEDYILKIKEKVDLEKLLY